MDRNWALDLLYRRANESDPNHLFMVVKTYIDIRKDINWQPQGKIDIYQLQSNYEIAKLWLTKHFNINFLYDKKGNIIKIF